MSNIKLIGIIFLCIGIATLIALAGGQGSLPGVGPISLFALCAAIGFVLHWLVFVPSFIAQTEHYFDLTGSLSFISAVCVAFLFNPSQDLRTSVMSFLIIVWALRLGYFLFTRVKRDGKDGRFDEIKVRFWRFAFTWTLGGLWVFLTMAAPLAAITSSNKVAMDLFGYIGLIVWIVGFSIEVIADYQKSQFRKDSDNKQKFITHGLWGWSRHPNYFGEIMLWIGLSIMALPTLAGWQLITLISPIFVILLLTRVSGVPMLEKRADEKWGELPEYQAYKQNTPVLVPGLSGS